MTTTLNASEERVLGALIEKELTTPEYYPLSLNSLTNACNQKSNRDPVLALAETDVVRALDGLRFKGLALQSGDGGRVPKYAHSASAKLHLDPAELAVLCELLLRGPQTLGELRTRCERMHPFADLAAVEEVLGELAGREEPLAVKLPRQPGRKESRFAQLLGAPPEPTTEPVVPEEPATRQVRGEDERIAALEAEVARLAAELTTLRDAFAAFRRQFE
ncbi:hypothetical protein DBW_1415 [Desulfuromonas sp. DDH964]|uniref:YceH family protein n=1 Tax=Desulfuromonas sp. DDH964 TaxID=1823759 RepID=UPI00078D2CFD|nr:YceH family protein [Desulfuromonas sp. DDH964]AMV71777.1 hypothetical protein DBW_1415 [Desulfuromonas sp. DDH964]